MLLYFASGQLLKYSFTFRHINNLRCFCNRKIVFCSTLFSIYNDSAIQNAPNPGGGDLQKPLAKLSPLKVQPRKLSCRGQTGCKGPCSAGESSRNSGQFSAQIENTPILCPFHLQPVPEYEMLCFTFISHSLQ